MQTIVHLFNTANVGQVVVKELVKRGYRANLIVRPQYNKFGILDDFTEVVHGSAKKMYLTSVKSALKANVVHIHASFSVLRIVDFALRKLLRRSRKKIIIHCHGTEIRGSWSVESRWKLADAVLVSTPDLLDGAPENVEYLPNPVDTSLWSRQNDPIPNSGVYVMANSPKYEERGIEWAKSKCNGQELRVLPRVFPPHIYPRVMELFENYYDRKYDWRTGEVIPAMSLNALQFLALGGKVHFLEEVYHGLPREHDVASVVDRLEAIYL